MAHVFRIGDRVKRVVNWDICDNPRTTQPMLGDQGTVYRDQEGYDGIAVLFDRLPERGILYCTRTNIRYIGKRLNPASLLKLKVEL